MTDIERRAKAAYEADKAEMAIAHPQWPMPPWSQLPAWRKRPYLNEAERMAAK